jgi:hypothetical protein
MHSQIDVSNYRLPKQMQKEEVKLNTDRPLLTTEALDVSRSN